MTSYPADEASAAWHDSPQTTRRDRALMDGFDPHPDDMAPSAQWVQDQEGGELLDALAASVEQARQLTEGMRPVSIGTPGFHEGIEEAEYHRDRASLSVSGAKVILKSPSLFRYQQDHPVHKDAFDFGSAAHQLVLGVGPGIAVIPATSRQKADQEAHKVAKEAARAEGKIPVTAEDYERVQAMADRLSSHTLAMRLLSEGRPEVSAYALDEETGVMRRGRFDWLHPTLLVDYKSCLSADPRDLAGRYGVVRKWGYDQQAAWYTDLARALGHPATAFAFIFQEKTAPYQVTVAYVHDEGLWAARQRNREALERFRDCTETGLWPDYLNDTTAAELSLLDQTYQEEAI